MSARALDRWCGRRICTFRRGSCRTACAATAGCELDQLGAVDVLDGDRSDASEIEFATRPTMRFHGSIPAFVDQLKALMESEARMLIAAPNQGEVERLAGLLQEYGVAYRMGSRVQQARVGRRCIRSRATWRAICARR